MIVLRPLPLVTLAFVMSLAGVAAIETAARPSIFVLTQFGWPQERFGVCGSTLVVGLQ